MQEMKFRVYNKKLKKWYKQEKLILRNGYIYESPMHFLDDIALNPENIDVEWFTGLEDLTGKDIYEGNIINFWDYGDEYTAIVKKKNLTDWCFEGVQDNFGKTYLFEGYFEDYCEEVKVIGNIHDNPELL